MEDDYKIVDRSTRESKSLFVYTILNQQVKNRIPKLLSKNTFIEISNIETFIYDILKVDDELKLSTRRWYHR
jgi:hypothetical protein